MELAADPYIFTDVVDGSEPWSPDAVSQYFDRMRKRVDLDHVKFHHLRKFMETYGQEAGFSVAQVAMRAGHDPSIAATLKHDDCSAQECVDTLIAAALDGGGSDNVTAILVRCH